MGVHLKFGERHRLKRRSQEGVLPERLHWACQFHIVIAETLTALALTYG